MLKRKHIIFCTLLLTGALTGLWKLQQPRWLVLNEQEQYINLIKNSSMPTIAVAVPVNQYIWQTIKSLNELARELTKSKLAVILPMDVPMILETAQKAKKIYNMNLDIYLAPKKLWLSLVPENKNPDQEEHAKYVFIQNHRVKKIAPAMPEWTLPQNAQLLDNMFDKA